MTTLTVESDVDHTRHVVTIQVVLEAALLKAADRAARRLKLNRSAFIRDAVRSHLQELQVRARQDARICRSCRCVHGRTRTARDTNACPRRRLTSRRGTGWLSGRKTRARRGPPLSLPFPAQAPAGPRPDARVRTALSLAGHRRSHHVHDPGRPIGSPARARRWNERAVRDQPPQCRHRPAGRPRAQGGRAGASADA